MGRRGFTLIELMMVVAIVATLVALALPRLHAMQVASKRAEPIVLVDTFYGQLNTYIATEGHTDSIDSHGPATPGKALEDWGYTGGLLDMAGIAPDGKVRCQYAGSDEAAHEALGITAICDADGDGNDAQFVRGRSNTTAACNSWVGCGGVGNWAAQEFDTNLQIAAKKCDATSMAWGAGACI